MILNAEQQSAVTTNDGRAMILAGAGSGKTRVLIERIAHLIENCKVSPYEIICWTFTRKAAGEMKERLEDRLGSQSYGVTIGTMHAIALRFIRRFGEELKLRPYNVTVYSEWEEQFLLKQIASEMGVFKKSWKIPKKDIDAMFARYYQEGDAPGPDEKGYALFRYFHARCRENNALTYGGLLHAMHDLIPTIRTYDRFRHVMVDEVQDIDTLQWKIIEKMCSAFNADLFVVGDFSQSIFSWRGARPEYLIENKQGFKTYQLKNNYRSGISIVDSANKLISHDTNGLPIFMNPKKRTTGSITHCNQADSKRLVECIKMHKPQAIMSRMHILLQSLANQLDDAGIDYHYVGKKSKLVNTETFRRFTAFLKLIVNPYDNFAFMLIKDIVGVDNEEYAAIRFRSSQSLHSHFQQWALENEGSKWEKFFRDSTENGFIKTLGELDTLLGQISYSSDDMSKAFWFASQWWDQALDPNAGISEYLDWLATYDLQDELVDDDPRLQLMSIHAAKGLEWPSVMLIGCNEDIIPSKQAKKSDDIDGERRLFYVAITRAEENLMLAIRPTASTGKAGREYHNPSSRFLKEMII